MHTQIRHPFKVVHPQRVPLQYQVHLAINDLSFGRIRRCVAVLFVKTRLAKLQSSVIEYIVEALVDADPT